MLFKTPKLTLIFLLLALAGLNIFAENPASAVIGGEIALPDSVVMQTVDIESTDEAPYGGGGEGPITDVLLQIVIVLLAAKIGGDIAVRLHQPEVLGELVMGVVLGSCALFGLHWFDGLKTSEYITILSELGVILLLFEVGLETNVKEMASVGTSALIVALLGVVVPFFLGWGVAWFFIPDADTLVHVFVGATLTATSVGITARVLKDIGKIQAKESKIILGAAVIDDVLGLMTLAVVSGIIAAVNAGGEFQSSAIFVIIGKAVAFLGGAIILGHYCSAPMMKAATYLRSRGLLLAISLVVCFGLAYIAQAIAGLAAIVGAFTAGLILDEVHYEDLAEKDAEGATIEELIAPITSLLVPIFFVVMGARVDVSVFGNVSILGFALVLTFMAIIGKQVCAFGVREKDIDGTAVGLGMIPRGEVGLIFAGIGASLTLAGKPVIDSATFGAVVIMVIVTTMVTPPLIKWRFGQLSGSEPAVES